MRKVVVLLYVLLGAWFFSTPSKVDAGDYGCRATYYQQGSSYSYPSYYTPRYTYAAGYYPATYSSTPYVATPPVGSCVDTPNGTVCNQGYQTPQVIPYAIPTDTYSRTVYSVAPDLAQNRIAAEAAAQAIAQLEVKMQKQAELAEAKADKAESRAIQQQMLQVLASLKQQQQPQQPVSYPAPPIQQGPVFDAEKEQLKADRALLMATIQKLAANQQTAPPPAPNPVPPSTGAAPPIPAGQPVGSLVDKVKAHVVASCMPCHGADKAPRLNLTDPGKLNYAQLSDCVNRMISDDPKFMMPKNGKNVPLEVVSDFHRLSMTAAK